MTDPVPDRPAAGAPGIMQPCAESCAAFRPLVSDPWSDYGVCTNPRAPACGFPVRIGRECRHYRPQGEPKEITRAS